MTEKVKNFNCQSCKISTPDYDCVILSTEGGSPQKLCTRCHNKAMAEYHGIKFEHVQFDSIGLYDTDKVLHKFYFRVRLLGSDVAIDAFELKHGSSVGYAFMVVGDSEEDILKLYHKLYERIKRALNRKHIERVEGELRITDAGVVRGQISCADTTDGRIPCLIIDGKEVSWDELGRMLMTYEGFQFKLEIKDSGEEI